ncbi:putative odorant-binding protein A10 [Diaphorina citri]|uniref:Odorant-binding protein A10 n=1 Tax=Diaphorina citri TaxID=121845 RepID=A0A1S3D424_DIACI|nr:putative odorant-binding protein A10 [Diaphorina citri]XP_026680701.1 putative odorant-binding protein A10 [Diaphorina citri]
MFKAEFLVFGMLLAFTLAYDTTYDDFDYEGMLKNERLVKNLVECLLSDEECANPVFQEVKKYAPEILETVCAKCTDQQKATFKKCTNLFMQSHHDDYEAIMKKMDPENKFRGPLEAFLAEP